MPWRPLERRLSKHQPLAFSSFMRLLASASSASRKFPHTKACPCSEEISFDEKLPNLSDSSDEEDSREDVQAEFEFFDPKPTDFNGVKILLQNYLDDKEWDLSSFVDLILEQKTVGTVVKVADDEDDAIFGVVTVLKLARYKKKAQDVGLLVSQRVMNLPPQLLPPLYDGLFDEVSWATEDEPTEELRSSFRFKSYLLFAKIYKLKNSRQSKVRHGEEDNEETIFVKPEDELFLQLSSLSFTFPMRSQLVLSQELKNYQLMGLVMVVKADKIHVFRQMLNSLIDE